MSSSEPSEAPASLAAAPLRIGVVTLRVRDLERVGDYYRGVVGLELLEAGGGRALLGAGDEPLLELLGDSASRALDPRGAGLFHTAFVMPSRGDLGSWLRHVVAERAPISGASDHAVSEAIYLSDPEGNGVEVYADRPRTAWSRVDGAIALGSEPLDLDGLLRADPDRRWSGAPRGLVVGHIHLQVGAIPPADAFYGDLLGFEVTCRYPGASFFGAGGYHHQVATNTWNSRDAVSIDKGEAGLERFEILVRDPQTLAEIRRRAASAGLDGEPAGDGFALRDPWGVTIVLKTK